MLSVRTLIYALILGMVLGSDSGLGNHAYPTSEPAITTASAAGGGGNRQLSSGGETTVADNCWTGDINTLTIKDPGYASGGHTRNQKQYLVIWSDMEKLNCGSLDPANLTTTPDLPTGLAIGSDATGIFLNGNMVEESSQRNYQVSAEDLDGKTGSFSFSLEVEADQSISFPSGEDPYPTPNMWTQGQPITPLTRNTNWTPGNAPNFYEFAQGASPPSGILIDSVTGEISGTPSMATSGEVTFSVEIYDVDGDNYTAGPISVTVAEPPPPKTTNNAPRIKTVEGDNTVFKDTGSFVVATSTTDPTQYEPLNIDLDEYWEDNDSPDILYAVEFLDDRSRSFLDFTHSANSNVLVVEGKKHVAASQPATLVVYAWGSDERRAIGAEQNFRFSVADRVPIISTFTPSIRMVPGATEVIVNLDQKFTDPDGDSLTYEATPLDPSITAESTNQGKHIVVTAADDAPAPGRTSVSINAVGYQDIITVLIFFVTSPQAPYKLEETRTPDQTLEISDTGTSYEPYSIHLESIFHDPDNAEINYTASSSDPQVATVEVTDNVLTVSGVREGSTNIRLSAADTEDQTAEQATDFFRVTVPNLPPIKQMDPDDISMSAGETRTVSLAGIFSDPDDTEPDSFVGESSDTAVTVAPATGGVELSVIPQPTVEMVTITVSPREHTDVTATCTVTIPRPTTPTTADSGGGGGGGGGQSVSPGGNTQTTTNATVPPSPTDTTQQPSPPDTSQQSSPPDTAQQPAVGNGGQGNVSQNPSGGGSGGGSPPTNFGAGTPGGGGPPSSAAPVAQVSGTSFTDSVGTTHEVNINLLAEGGITRGCNPPENSRFCPDRAVTRGEMATFMVRAFDLTPSSSNLFGDDNGNTHEANINALAAAEITRGCNPPENSRYCPDRPVTRAQMATFLARALDLEDGSGDFEDTSDSPHASDINRIATVEITRGCNPPENTRFCPDRAVTRGEMATFLIRAEDLDDN